MDSVTQAQNYLSSISGLMAASLHGAIVESQSVSVEQLHDTIRAEHQRAAEERVKEQTGAMDGSAAATSVGVKEEGAAAAAMAQSALDASASPAPPPIPDLGAPLYSGLPPSVEIAVSDRAHQLFKRVMEADVLLASLPPLVGGAATLSQQMQQLAYLEVCNQHAGEELAHAQEQAKLWQKRVSYVLQQAAAAQLRTITQTDSKRAATPASTDNR